MITITKKKRKKKHLKKFQKKKNSFIEKSHKLFKDAIEQKEEEKVK